MKKLVYLLLMGFFVISVSGCSGKNETSKNSDKIPNPVKDPAGYIPDMVNLNDRMKNNIKNATDKENERLQKSLEGNDQEN